MGWKEVHERLDRVNQRLEKLEARREQFERYRDQFTERYEEILPEAIQDIQAQLNDHGLDRIPFLTVKEETREGTVTYQEYLTPDGIVTDDPVDASQYNRDNPITPPDYVAQLDREEYLAVGEQLHHVEHVLNGEKEINEIEPVDHTRNSSG